MNQYFIDKEKIEQLKRLSEEYNDERYFRGDPIIFPKFFLRLMEGYREKSNEEWFADLLETSNACNRSDYEFTLKDVEIAGIIAAHLAWGRRDMILRDCKRAFDQMKWQPYKYVMEGNYKDDDTSLHRTIKWSEFAQICKNLKKFYQNHNSLEELDAASMRVTIFSQKENPKAANKKIHMFRRWMVRDDKKVDLGLWKKTTPDQLIIPLDVHVHRSAINLGITNRRGADITTALEITQFLKEIFPDDPCKGDFALFAYAATVGKK